MGRRPSEPCSNTVCVSIFMSTYHLHNEKQFTLEKRKVVVTLSALRRIPQHIPQISKVSYAAHRSVTFDG